jgi:uncharacterized protein (DUF2147 family)
MQKFWLAAVALACLSGPALGADETGTWLVKEKTAVVKVERCEAGLCGLIGWAQTPGPDRNNPDPKLRDRNIVGMQIFSMKAGQNRWEGEIYNAQDGKTYKGSVALVGPNTLKIEGCVLGFLCGGENWTRVKCDEPPTGQVPPAAKRPPGDKSAPKGTAVAASAFVPLTGCRAVGP